MELEAQDRVEPFRLVARDIEILEHLADGLTDQEIALKLKVGLATVHKRVRAVLQKTMSTSRTEAAIKALKAGIIASIVILVMLTVIPMSHGHASKPEVQPCVESSVAAEDNDQAISGDCRSDTRDSTSAIREHLRRRGR